MEWDNQRKVELKPVTCSIRSRCQALHRCNENEHREMNTKTYSAPPLPPSSQSPLPPPHTTPPPPPPPPPLKHTPSTSTSNSITPPSPHPHSRGHSHILGQLVAPFGGTSILLGRGFKSPCGSTRRGTSLGLPMHFHGNGRGAPSM